MAISRRSLRSSLETRTALGRAALLIAGLLAGGWWASDVIASTLLDHAETVSKDGAAEVRITFARPVAYRRHAPPEAGQIVRIELDVPGFDASAPLPNEEYLRVPPTAGVPGFFVLYRPGRDNETPTAPLVLTVQFDAPTPYALRPGADGRSLVLVVPARRSDDTAPAVNGSAVK
jgi:hypothetical protein